MCHNCEKRYPACHSTCDKYRMYKANLEKTKANRRDYYMTARASFDIALKHKMRSNKPLGNMRVF